MSENISTEFKKMLELTDEHTLKDMIDGWLTGDITPESLATFFLRLSDFKDMNRLTDVFDRVIHFAYLGTHEVRQAEEDWKTSLLAQLEDKVE
jgi:hypothetical protein